MAENTFESLAASDFFSAPFLVGNVGAPFIIGMAVGYFAKKMLRMALFVGGALLALLFIGEYYNILDINELYLQTAASNAVDAAKQSGSFLFDRVAHITSKGVSGTAGFIVGFKLA